MNKFQYLKSEHGKMKVLRNESDLTPAVKTLQETLLNKLEDSFDTHREGIALIDNLRDNMRRE